MERKIFAVLFLTVFASMLGVAIVGPLMPIYSQSLGATGIWLGIIFAMFPIARAIFMPIIGKQSDKKGRKRYIWIGLLSYFIMSLGYVWSQTVYELTIVRFLHGIASAMVLPIAMAYAAEIAPKGKEGQHMGTFNMSLLLGLAIGPLIGGILTDTFSIAAPFYMMGFLAIISMVMVLISLPDDKTSLKKEYRNISFKKMLKDNNVRGICAFRAVNAFGTGAVFVFLPVFAISSQMSLSQIGFLLSLFYLLMTILQRPSGKLADRFDKAGIILVGSVGASIAIIMLPKFHNFLGLLVVSVVMALFGSLSLPAATAFVAELGRVHGMGSTMGIFNVAMSIGFATGPLVSGVLMDLLGLSYVFYFGGMMGVFGSLLFYWMVKS